MSESASDGKDSVSVEADNQLGNSSAKSEKIGTFTALSVPNFRFLFTGTVFTTAAQWLQQVTLNWLVYHLTSSGVILGFINLVRAMASFFMVPLAGVLIDRVKHRSILTAVNLWLFVISFSLGLAIIFTPPQIYYLFVFASLGGIAMIVDFSLRQVLVFELLPRKYAPNGIALIQTGWALMRSVGPALGGFLIVLVGPGGNFLVQASAYLLIMITILQIKFPPKTTRVLQASPLRDIKEGFKYLFTHRTTQLFALMGLILPLFIVPVFIVLPPIYAVKVFGDESGLVLGFLMAAVGCGGIAGGFVIASLSRFDRRGLLQLGSIIMLCLSLIGFAFCRVLIIALLCLAMAGFFEIIFMVNNQTLLQLSIPDNLRGRITTAVNLHAVLAPLGGLLAGTISDFFGGPKMSTIVMVSTALIIAVLFLVFSPTVRNYRLSKAMVASAKGMKDY